MVVMDADLQDPPSMLLEMKNLLDQNEDLDCVGTRRTSREGEPVLRSLCANLFYRLMKKISILLLRRCANNTTNSAADKLRRR